MPGQGGSFGDGAGAPRGRPLLRGFLPDPSVPAVCVQVSSCPIGCPHRPSVLVPGVEDAAAGVRLELSCDGARPVSHPDTWMQLLAQDSLQQLNDP